MKWLLGIHITPPERDVVPPMRGIFSSTTTLLSIARMTSAETIEPPPLPTEMKSNSSSN